MNDVQYTEPTHNTLNYYNINILINHETKDSVAEKIKLAET